MVLAADMLLGILNADPINLVWLGLGVLFALPGALFVAATTVQRAKAASVIGAFFGCVLGFFVTMFVWGKAFDSVHLEGAVVLVGTFFIASMLGLVGALLVNFVFAGNSPAPTSQVEY